MVCDLLIHQAVSLEFAALQAQESSVLKSSYTISPWMQAVYGMVANGENTLAREYVTVLVNCVHGLPSLPTSNCLLHPTTSTAEMCSLKRGTFIFPTNLIAVTCKSFAKTGPRTASYIFPAGTCNIMFLN